MYLYYYYYISSTQNFNLLICSVIYTELNASIDALAEVNTTVAQLETLTELLQLELDRITYQTTGLMIMCSLASNVTTVCNIIPNISYTVAVDYSKVIACLYIHIYIYIYIYKYIIMCVYLNVNV